MIRNGQQQMVDELKAAQRTEADEFRTGLEEQLDLMTMQIAREVEETVQLALSGQATAHAPGTR